MFRIATRLNGRRVLFHSQKINDAKCHKQVQYSTKKPEYCPPQKGGSTGTKWTLGALVLATGAAIGYAKYDPEFRSWLKEKLPITDDILKVLFFEGLPFWQKEATEEKKVYRKAEVCQETPTTYRAPVPVMDKLASDAKQPEEYMEIRVTEKLKDVDDEKVEVVEKLKKDVEKTPVEKIAELEAKIAESAACAIKAFNKSKCALENYNNDIEIIVEESVENVDPEIWNGLKDKTIEKNRVVSEAERCYKETVCQIKELKSLLMEEVNAPLTSVERVQENLTQIQHDLTHAKHQMDKEVQFSNVTEKYWNNVASAREHFGKELEALFPSVNFKKKDIEINSADLDLFVLHALTKVLFLQKELHRKDTVGNQRLKEALETAKSSGDAEVLTREQICQQLEKEKRCWEEEHNRKCLELRKKSESELRHKLKVQSEVFNDHLHDALRTREMEMSQELNRKYDEELQGERTKYKMQVSAMVGRLRGMEHALKARSDADKTAKQAQVLWNSCQALFKAVKASCLGKSKEEQLKPLSEEISAILKSAGGDDELVNVVIDGIPSEAKTRGVFAEDVLRARFLNVEKVARNLALLSEKGGRLHMYFLSYLQSLLLLNASNPIPSAELNDEKVDFSKLSTNEILQRARYWLDRGDFLQALKYMNLLQGAPRSIARQWMNETRILLETQQAANTLMAYATSNGLMYL